MNAKAFEAFPCHEFDGDGKWLVADVRVQCDTPEHERIKSWAWAAIVLYPIGWTATTAVLLFKARKSITGSAEATDLSKALSFVYTDYDEVISAPHPSDVSLRSLHLALPSAAAAAAPTSLRPSHLAALALAV